MRSMAARAAAALSVARAAPDLDDPAAGASSATAKASASVAFVMTAVELDAEVDDGLRDLRADAADDAVGAHQARRGDRLQQVLRHQRVDGRHAGDVDDGDLRAGRRRCVCSRFSITTWVRALSSVPISGSASTPSHSLTTGVDSSEHLLAAGAAITSSRVFW